MCVGDLEQFGDGAAIAGKDRDPEAGTNGVGPGAAGR